MNSYRTVYGWRDGLSGSWHGCVWLAAVLGCESQLALLYRGAAPLLELQSTSHAISHPRAPSSHGHGHRQTQDVEGIWTGNPSWVLPVTDGVRVAYGTWGVCGERSQCYVRWESIWVCGEDPERESERHPGPPPGLCIVWLQLLHLLAWLFFCTAPSLPKLRQVM